MAETIKGINIKLNLDGKDLDNELKAINKELKEQQKDLRAINSNLRYDNSNIELWRKKQIQLNEILDATKKRLDTQNKQLEKAKQGLKLGTVSEAEFRKVQRNVSYSEAEVKKLNNELSKTKDKIRDLGNVKYDNLTKVGSSLSKGLTAPILGAVTALSALSKKGINTANEFKTTAAKLGLSIEALQEWNHIAKMSGVETNSLEKAFGKVNTILADISLGNVKSFAGVFHTLGISIDELKGINTDEAFDLITTALEKVHDESLRVALANHLFGDKLGSELIPLLKLEKDAIVALRNEANMLGIITTEQASQAGRLSDNIDKLKQSFIKLTVEIGMVMMPLFETLVDNVQNKIIPSFNKMIFYWQNLSDGTKRLITFLIGLTAAIGPMLTIAGKVGPIIKTVSIAFKALGNAGVFAGIGINAATLGIGALIAIVAIALMKSDKFKELLAKLFEVFMRLLIPIIKLVDVLMEALKPILDVIINIITKLIDILIPIIDLVLTPLIIKLEFLGYIFEMLSPLIEMVGRVLQKVLVPAFQVLERVLTPILKVLEKIIEFFNNIFNFAFKAGDIVNNALSGVFDNIGSFVSNIGSLFGGVSSKLTDLSKEVVHKVSGAIEGTVGKLTEFANNSISAISSVSKNVVEGISKFANQAKDKVSGFFGKVGGLFGGAFNLKKESRISSQISSNQNTTHNTVTINTSSPTFDIDSINRALGGKFI